MLVQGVAVQIEPKAGDQRVVEQGMVQATKPAGHDQEHGQAQLPGQVDVPARLVQRHEQSAGALDDEHVGRRCLPDRRDQLIERERVEDEAGRNRFRRGQQQPGPVRGQAGDPADLGRVVVGRVPGLDRLDIAHAQPLTLEMPGQEPAKDGLADAGVGPAHEEAQPGAHGRTAFIEAWAMSTSRSISCSVIT
jgi:hypothetical protein